MLLKFIASIEGTVNFSQLKYIVAVDRHRNFSRAADECDIAQSTLSREIQRLESEFNIVIFDRSRIPITPTMKGEDLIAQAKLILKEHDVFIEMANKMNNLPKGRFRLGILSMLAPYLLPLFVTSISKKYPELNLEIEELTNREMITYFEEERMDGAITISPFIRNGYYEEPLFKEDFVLYVSPKHPLYKKEQVQWKDISPDELLLHESFKHYFIPDKASESLLPGIPKVTNINYQSGSLETIRKIIDRNGGITLLPKLACLYMGARRLKMVRFITQPVLNRTILLVTPRGFEKKRITKVIKHELLLGVDGKL